MPTKERSSSGTHQHSLGMYIGTLDVLTSEAIFFSLENEFSLCTQRFIFSIISDHKKGAGEMKFVSGLPDFSWHNIPKREKMYQIPTK
jgi:hypothetical protein